MVDCFTVNLFLYGFIYENPLQIRNMRMKRLWKVLPVFGLLMLSACSASRYYFVLITDSDGKVGEISIENENPGCTVKVSLPGTSL